LSDPRTQIFGQTAHRDPQWGFSFWRPRNWKQLELDEPHGIVYYPEDDPRTGFYVLAQDLSAGLDAPITEADLPDLRAGILDGLYALPQCQILSEAEIGRESAIGLEFTLTFKLDGEPCKRCLRLLCRDRQQFTLYGQGVPPAEYDLFANIYDWMYLTFTFGDVLEELANMHAQIPPA
jgi:hypothetical protein